MSILATRLALALFAATAVAAAPAPTYVAGRQIAGPDGGWDYARVDPATRRLYVAHGDVVTEIDLANGDAVRSFGTFAKAHAVVPIPGGMLLVTSGRDNSVRLFDTGAAREVARIAVGADPDAAFYDPATGHAVVMNAKGGTVSVIDIATRRIVRTIPLKAGLEYGVLGGGGTLFVNNEDANEIETANLATGKVGPAIPLAGCEGPTGLAFDAKTNRLIGACANGKAAVVDAGTHRLVTLLDIGRGPDAAIVDARRRLAFIPCGRDGVLDVIALDAPGGARVIGTVKTEPGARTGALDPSDGSVYLPTARFSPAATAGDRPVALPGTFHVLAVSPN
ncbi:YncE family protein [Sphingobium aquiterrae]|uniref:YncE family protein n=1 Tax=Sphingobium aquiterrae TaxID=2038656 RepID=UPI00301B3A86